MIMAIECIVKVAALVDNTENHTVKVFGLAQIKEDAVLQQHQCHLSSKAASSLDINNGRNILHCSYI